MEARLRRCGDITVIAIQGALPIEQTQSFREVVVQKFSGKQVVFNLEKATFVGSNGLQAFLDTILSLDQGSELGVRVVGAKSEFRRLLSSLEARRIEFFEDEGGALKDWAPRVALDLISDSGQG